MRKRVTTEDFIRRARAAHGERYDYSRAVWVSTHAPITIVCPRHGPFEQRAGNHLRGRGCRLCANEGIAPIHIAPPCESEARVRKLHPGYVLDRESYQGSTKPATWRCTRHDSVFRASARSLAAQEKVGCPGCIAEARRARRREARHDPKAEQHLAIVAARFDGRHVEAYTLYLDGATFKEIGAAFGGSKERARQWLDRILWVVDRFDRYGERRSRRRGAASLAPLRSLFELDGG